MSKHSPKPKQLTEQEMKDLKEAFNLLDADGNGLLDLKELSNFMDSNGFDSNNAQLVLAIFDRDHDGTISWNEFIEFVQVLNSEDELQLYQLLFKAMDLDNSGSLSYDEVQKFLSYFGVIISNEEAQQFIEAFDKDHSGALSFEEIMQALNSE